MDTPSANTTMTKNEYEQDGVVPDPTGPADAKPARHGETWTEQELGELINGIRSRLTLETLARQHERSAGGIRGAAHALLASADQPPSHSDALAVLAARLADEPGYDALAAYRANRPKSAVARRDARPPAVTAARPTPSPLVVAPSRESRGLIDRDVGNDSPTFEIVAGAPESLDDADIGALLTEVIETLPILRLRDIMMCRLGLMEVRPTLAAIGESLGISGERVRQLQERALDRLASNAHLVNSAGHVLSALLAHRTAALTDADEADRLAELLDGQFATNLQFAIVVALRAGGASKQRAQEVAAIADLRVKQRIADQQLAQRALTTAMRVDAVVSTWLDEADWPEETAPPPPIDALRAARSVNAHDGAGRFESSKLARTISYESGLERDVLTVLEKSDLILSYQEQPTTIAYEHNGWPHLYFPDVFAVTADGRGLLIEVKPLWQIALSVNRAKADAARMFAHAHGWGWLSVAGKHTSRALISRTLSREARDALTRRLRDGASLGWRDIRTFCDQYAMNSLDIAAYVLQEEARLELLPYRLSAGNRVGSGE